VIVCSESNKNADPRRRFGSNVNIIHLDTGHQRSATFRKRQTNRFKRNPFKLSFLDRSAVEQRRGEMNPYNSYAPNSLELGGLTDLKNELQIDGIPIGIDFLQPPYPGYDAAQSPLPLSNGIPQETLSNRYRNNQSLHLRAPRLAQPSDLAPPTSGGQDKIMSGQLTTVRRRSSRVRFATSERSQLLSCSCSGHRQ
jgi:hypothetical protein